MANNDIVYCKNVPLDNCSWNFTWDLGGVNVKEAFHKIEDSQIVHFAYMGGGKMPGQIEGADAINMLRMFKDKGAKVVVHQHSSPTQLLDPDAIWHPEVFDLYKEQYEYIDYACVNSKYFAKILRKDLREWEKDVKVIVTGYPYKPLRIKDVDKEAKTVLINSRFALEKMHNLEIIVAKRLFDAGYRILRSKPKTEIFDKELFEYATKVCGFEFGGYEELLKKAESVLVVSANDTLGVSALDGIMAGCKVVAPNDFAFPEFVPFGNLYAPYDIEDMLMTLEDYARIDDPDKVEAKYSAKRYKEILEDNL